MVHRLVIASLFIGATAYAQAPGDTDMQNMQDGGGAPGQVAPVAANPCGGCPYAAAMAAPRNVMAHRFAVGLSIGSMSVAPQMNPDAKTDFGVGQLSFRYRATYHLDLELALGGGQETLQDGTPGDREISVGTLGVRYRFAAAQNWNWWLMGSLGVVSITSKGAGDAERKDAQRPMGELGIGLERRFNHFALQAELRAAGMGETKGERAAGMTTVDPTSTKMQPPPVGTPTSSRDVLSGGTFTLGASWYF